MGWIYESDENRFFIKEKGEGDIGFIDLRKEHSKYMYDSITEGPIQITIPFTLGNGKPRTRYLGDGIKEKITILNTTNDSVNLNKVDFYDSKP